MSSSKLAQSFSNCTLHRVKETSINNKISNFFPTTPSDYSMTKNRYRRRTTQAHDGGYTRVFYNTKVTQNCYVTHIAERIFLGLAAKGGARPPHCD